MQSLFSSTAILGTDGVAGCRICRGQAVDAGGKHFREGIGAVLSRCYCGIRERPATQGNLDSGLPPE